MKCNSKWAKKDMQTKWKRLTPPCRRHGSRVSPCEPRFSFHPQRFDFLTEVVLRNLVAFEASAAPGALIFTRYTDFMNGIIDIDEDVRLLTKSGILFNHLADGGQVASCCVRRPTFACHLFTRFLFCVQL
ncbi:hypothetical protein SUGI_0241760 [Cryptomeria japonica]|nr:hypothetical protein SUGI_0241760 [Cryptomeria japonica]